MKDNKDSIFQKWFWDPRPLRIIVAIFILIPSALALVFYFLVGARAFCILAFASIGVGAWIVLGAVGKRVQALRCSLSSEEGEPVDSLIVNGKIQSPGIALLREDELVLVPIVGERVAVPLADIRSVRETSWYNGSLLWFKKKGFWLDVPGRKRLGVAVTNSYAELFRNRLSREARSHTETADPIGTRS